MQIADASVPDAQGPVADAAIADAVSTVDGALGDAVVTTDGGTGADGGTATDGSTTACLADPAGYGTATLTNQAGSDSGDGSMSSIYGELNTDVDAFYLELWGGFGVFGTGPVTPGTYDIALDDPTYATCGVCAFVVADSTGSLADPNGVYFAASGQLTLTSVTPSITGSVDNLVLNHVTIDPDTLDTTIVGDCQTTITHADFDAPTAAAFAGGHVRLHLRKPAAHHGH
jgi:hypothetical protein